MFWLRSVRRRPAAATLLAVLSAVAVASAVLAPMLLRAVEQATLADALRHAGLRGTSVAAASEITVGELSASEGAVTAATATLADDRLWQAPVIVAESDGTAKWEAAGSSAHGTAPIAGVSGPCRGMRITSGHCPSGKTELLAPTGSGLRVGDHLSAVVTTPQYPFPQDVAAVVVGTYDPGAGTGPVVGGSGRLFGAGGDAEPDLVMGLDGFDALGLPGTVWSVRTITDAVGLDDVGAVRDGIASAEQAALTAESAASSVTVVQSLGEVLTDVQTAHRDAALVVAVAGVQTVALAWAAQAVIVARLGRARAAEWGLARLRGLPRRRRLTTVLVEPLVAALVGSAVGLAAGVPLAATLGRALLGPGTEVDPLRAPVALAAGTAVAGSLVALVVASVRPALLPLVDLLRRTSEPRTLSRTGAVVQAVGVVAAAVAVAGIVTQQRLTGPGVALLAPTLVAVLVAVVGLRIAVPLVRGSSGRRRGTRTGGPSATGLLVVRRLARTPSILTTAVVVTIGVAIAVSSCQTAAYAARVQDDRAAATLGAPTVLDVHVRRGVSFVDAVRSAARTSTSSGGDADPVAVAVETTTDGNDVGRVVAVDTASFGRFWDPSWGGRSLAALQHTLRPSTGPSLRITGDHLAVTLADVGDPDGGTLSADLDSTELFAVVAADDGWHRVVFGSPHDGTLQVAVPCTGGCRLVTLGIDRTVPDGTPYGLGATVRSVAASVDGGAPRSVGREWLDPDRWRDRIGDASTPSDRPTGTVGAHGDGLRVDWTDPTGSGEPAIATHDVPQPFPALVGADTNVQPFPGIAHATLGIGLDRSSRVLRIVGRAPSLPRLLDVGAMVDLTLADRDSDPASAVTDHEVWLAAGDHADVVSALLARGVTVTSTHHLAAAEERARRAAPTLGAFVGAASAVAALVLTGLTALAVGLLGAPAARRDAEVLTTAGFRRRRIRWLAFTEAFGPAVVAVALGAVAGSIATLLVVGRLPLRDGTAPPIGAPLGPWTALAVCGAALLVAAAVAAVTSAAVARVPSERHGASRDGSPDPDLREAIR